MNTNQLNRFMRQMGLDTKTLARLLGVTPRAINLWQAGTREIPNTAVAYIHLLSSIPSEHQLREISRAKMEHPIMYDGMYVVKFEGATGTGEASLVFVDGIIFGHDTGVEYDGIYHPCPNDLNFMKIHVRLSVPKGVELVLGVPAQPIDYSFEIEDRIPARQGVPLTITTPFGPINAQLEFLRALPQAFAA